MGTKNHVQAHFTPEHKEFTSGDGKKYEFEGTGPYDYLLGALSGCLYYTFKSLAEKFRLEWDDLRFEVNSEKRDETLQTLKEVHVDAVIRTSSDHATVTKCFETSTRYCSVFQTIGKVAEMHWSLNFAQ
ncbi:OsmC family protein [Parasphaerochaeta coccoides]|uniref:OsmC family protein n=1 Tax=Parasphaerochaeta coccoides (strain ATCC BAA-1237 / DSM 17374 / SPN1) TaxID=760011 RepID=F4GJU1_PARC1|nr:OsmC family protein [Parasphaerochaeta coccoides]AEC01366.1 OsmC family protein [Parasphaerochaeta coccoides DSM 17374]